MAFIKGRQIIVRPLIVDEIIAWAKKHKKRLMILKVDFEKAFDSLNWSLLNSIMTQMGFSVKWINWISSCLNSGYVSVLVNGSPTKEFKIEKGLRNNNIFQGIKVGKDNINVSHIQFADDALIMGEWSLMSVKNLSRILTCFHLASGLKVIFNKSKLFGIGVTNDVGPSVDELAVSFLEAQDRVTKGASLKWA